MLPRFQWLGNAGELERCDRFHQLPRLGAQTGGCCGHLLHQRCVLLGGLVHLVHRHIDLIHPFALLGSGRADLRHRLRHPLNGRDHLFHGLPGGADQHGASLNPLDTRGNERFDLLGGLRRACREAAHLRGHHGKTPSLLGHRGCTLGEGIGLACILRIVLHRGIEFLHGGSGLLQRTGLVLRPGGKVAVADGYLRAARRGLNSSRDASTTAVVRSPLRTRSATACDSATRRRRVAPMCHENSSSPIATTTTELTSARKVSLTSRPISARLASSSLDWCSFSLARTASTTLRVGIVDATRKSNAGSFFPSLINCRFCSATRQKASSPWVNSALSAFSDAEFTACWKPARSLSIRRLFSPISASVAARSSGVRTRMAWRTCKETRVTFNSMALA